MWLNRQAVFDSRQARVKSNSSKLPSALMCISLQVREKSMPFCAFALEILEKRIINICAPRTQNNMYKKNNDDSRGSASDDCNDVGLDFFGECRIQVFSCSV
jgi:hypothetical protein